MKGNRKSVFRRHRFYRILTIVLILVALSVEGWRLWIYETPEEVLVEALYRLPYPAGEKYMCIKGRGVSLYGHKGSDYYSVDFRMPEHSLVVAARGGIVLHVKDDSNIGGWSKKYIEDANRVNIDQGDETIAQYVHLEYKGALVKKGDRVEQGEPIGYSGNTGSSLMPHLHFCVGSKNKKGTMPIAFESAKRNRIIPKAYFSYVSNNIAPTSKD